MGGGLRSFDGKRCVVERSVFSSYKLSRAGDCFPRLEEIPEVALWHTCPGSDRQHHGDALFEQGGMDQAKCLDWKVREIIHWCLSMRITLSAVHISGQDDDEADHLSRF